MAGKAIVMALGLLLGASEAVFAQALSPDPVVTDAKNLRELQKFEEMLSVPGAAKQHRDLYYRELAILAHRHGDEERALKMFMRAASYADKPSQAALANMYWDGVGTAVDRPRAYAWMDLAATRGYNQFIAKREYYWSQLTEAERAQALRVGQEIFDQYNDKLTLHRLRLELDYVRMNVVGSHVGFVGPGKVTAMGSATINGTGTGPSGLGLPRIGGSNASSPGFDFGGLAVASLSEFYRPSVWKIDEYAKFKDIQWATRVESKPTVEVGDLQKVPSAEAPPAK